MDGLAIRDLTIEYASGGYVVRPIAGLDLDVGPGQAALLLGASGSGKTTLLSALAGLLTPKSGTIRFGDIDVTGLRGQTLTEYRRRTVGIVFQAFNLVPSLTALENVQAPLWAAGVRGGEARTRAARLLEQVDLADRTRHRPGDLSGGEQQRVAIARALANNPPIILADEPTANLDSKTGRLIIDLLQALRRDDRTVIIATHDTDVAAKADAILEMSDGQIVSTSGA